MSANEQLIDFLLRWPRDLFRARLADLLNESTHDAAWDDEVRMFLDDAFTTDAATGRFEHLSKQNDNPWVESGRAAAPAFPEPRNRSTAERFLARLLQRTDDLPDPENPKPYFSERRSGADSGILSRRVVAREFDQIVRSLRSRGYLAMRLGDDCVEDRGYVDASHAIEMQTGRGDLWPYDLDKLAADEESDDLLDLIEVMHDLVAQPRQRWHHGWDDCGWHYSQFSVTAGQEVFRWNINRLLARSQLGLMLSDDGRDYGRLLVTTDESRTALTRVLTNGQTPGTSDRVRHAMALYRQRGASVHHKRSACITLAGVLEERRELLKANLKSKDEGVIFELANRFAIRHQDQRQLADYDPVFLDWVFWHYLATVELTNRLLERERSTPGPR